MFSAASFFYTVHHNNYFRAACYLASVVFLAPIAAVASSTGVPDNIVVLLLIPAIPAFVWVMFAAYTLTPYYLKGHTYDPEQSRKLRELEISAIDIRSRALSLKSEVEKDLRTVKRYARDAAKMRVELLNMRKRAMKSSKLSHIVPELDAALSKTLDFKRECTEMEARCSDRLAMVKGILQDIEKNEANRSRLIQFDAMLHEKEQAKNSAPLAVLVGHFNQIAQSYAHLISQRA